MDCCSFSTVNQSSKPVSAIHAWHPVSRDESDKTNYPDKSGVYHCLMSDGSIELVLCEILENGPFFSPSRKQTISWAYDHLFILAWFPNPMPPSSTLLDYFLNHADAPLVAAVDEEVVLHG